MIEDLRFAIRSVRRSPGFALIAVGVLAGAIGINAAVLGIADAVLFRPLPYDAPNRLFVLHMVDQATGLPAVFVPRALLETLAADADGFVAFATIDARTDRSVVTSAGADTLTLVGVSANFFELLGVRAARGRLLRSDDEFGAPHAAVLSYGAWQRRFGSSPSGVGTTLQAGTTSVEVVGVLPADFVWPVVLPQAPDLVTLTAADAVNPETALVMARVPSHVSIAEAQARIDTAASPLTERDSPRPTLREAGPLLYPLARSVMTPLLGASLLVLLIGAVNLAILFGARARTRARDHGVCVALGGSRARLVRPLVTEALLLGVLGAAAGLLAAWWTFDWLLASVPPAIVRDAPVGLGGRVALASLLLGVASGLGFSVVPAWRASAADPLALLRGRPGGVPGFRWPLGRELVALQVALAIALATGALGARHQFASLMRAPLGFDPRLVLTLRVQPPETRGLEAQAFYANVLETLAARGDIVAAGAASTLPLDGRAPDEGVVATDGRRLPVGVVHVLPGYFEAAGLELVGGRWPDPRDPDGQPGAAVLSQSAARALVPSGDALGAVFRGTSRRQFEVVGIVTDVVTVPGQPAQPLAFVFPGEFTRSMTIVARARARDAALRSSIERHVRTLVPGTTVSVAWWSEAMSAHTAYRNPRFQAAVLGTLGWLAVGLAVTGTFAVMAFAGARRRHELGVRLAIGASPRSLVGTLLRDAVAPLAGGLVLGLLGATWAERVLVSLVPGVAGWGHGMLVPAATLVCAGALAAAVLAAVRASRLDPVEILRDA
jgi:putative ABC transport system permease protein